MKKDEKKIKTIVIGTINLNSLNIEELESFISKLYDNILSITKKQNGGN